MTTIGTITQEKPIGKQKMARKRIFINVEHLADGIDLVRQEIKKIEEEIKQVGLTVGRIPFRLHSGFHDSEMSYIVDSALLLLHKNMKTLSQPTWERYINRYKSIPTDNQPSGYQQGVALVVFYEKGEPSMVQLADEIADYIEAFVETPVPYLKMGGNTSYKIIGSLALIHAEEKLKEQQNSDITSEEVS